MRLKKILFLLFAAIVTREGFSQSPDRDKLDQYLHTLDTNNKLMGRVLLLQQGKNMYARSLGFSNIEMAIRPGVNSMYRIGSISKTITAALVLKAVEEGKIDLSGNIQGFFPIVKNAGQIKISDLLNHHSGIHNFTGGNFYNWNTKPISRHDLLDSIAKGGSDFEPGSKAAYSNSNYVLLSFILEDIYQQPYGSILHNKIIKPLHLTHFQFGETGIAPENKAIPYNFEAGWNKVAATDLSIPMGAGGILSTPEDLAKVIDAIFQGKMLSRRMLDTMKVQSNGFGLGVFEKQFFGKTAYTHDGAIDGFNSFFYYFPQDKTTYVLLSNAENYQLDTVNNSILSIVYNQPFHLPVFNSRTVSSTELDQYTGTYTSKSSPLVIEIWNKNNFLLAQPHGQKVYTMEATDKNKFAHEKTRVVLDFNPSEKQMLLQQGQQSIVFTKQ